MANDKTLDLFENRIGMRFDDAIEMIETYFSSQLIHFRLIDEYKESTGYWGLRYKYNAIEVFIKCDRGYLEIDMKHGHKNVALSEIDERMVHVVIASEKNINFSLLVVKKYCDSSAAGGSNL